MFLTPLVARIQASVTSAVLTAADVEAPLQQLQLLLATVEATLKTVQS
jgi:hypothetical protein